MSRGLLLHVDPVAWQHGFDNAVPWIEFLAAPGQADAFCDLVRLSLWPACGWPPYVPYVEGLMTGVYGEMMARREGR